MVGKDDLIFLPEIQNKSAPSQKEKFLTSSKFRLLTEDDFEALLKFDIT
jgi:hypothetical protein